MRVMLIVLTVVALFSWTWAAAAAEVPRIPPPFNFPFDVSRADTTVEKEFRVGQYRNYYFALRFDYAGRDDYDRVEKLVGVGNQKGVAVPIHLTIYQVRGGSNSQHYDGTVDTQGSYAHGFSEKKFHGNYMRMIVSIDLKPGLYRVRLNTIKATQEFWGTPSHVTIEYHPNARPLKE